MKVRGKNGNAMLYVLIVTMILSVMLLVTLNVTNYERRVTKSYREYANLYDMAQSGAEIAVAVFNSELKKRYNGIINAAMPDICALSIASDVKYINKTANVYGGDFYLAGSAVSKAFAENADKEVIKGLENIFKVNGDRLLLEYGVEIKNDDKYWIEVEIVPDKSVTPYQYELISTATIQSANQSNGAYAAVSGIISCGGGRVSREQTDNVIVIPVFTWENAPLWDVTAVNPYYPVSDFYFPALSFQCGWDKDTPVVVMSEQTDNIVDISEFYENGEARPTIIVCFGSGDLLITTANPAYNLFKGVIFSAGNILIEEGGLMVTEGSLIALGEIKLGDDSRAINSPGMLFSPVFTDETLRRRIYDFFRATRFNEGGDVLNASPTTGGGYLIKNMGDIKYYLSKLTSVY